METIKMTEHTTKFIFPKWIVKEKLNIANALHTLNQMPEASHFLINYPEYIKWNSFAYNPSSDAITTMLANKLQINWHIFCANKSIEMVDILFDKMEQDKVFETTFSHIIWSYISANNYTIVSKNHTQEYITKVHNKIKNYIIKNKKKINWNLLSENENDYAIQLLQENFDKINWIQLSYNSNPIAIRILLGNLDKINWDWLCLNKSETIIQFLRQYRNKINWNILSSNKSAAVIQLLRDFPENINWFYMSSNSSPEAIQLLSENIDKINWNELSSNTCPCVIKLFEKYPHLINYKNISFNPLIWSDFLSQL